MMLAIYHRGGGIQRGVGMVRFNDKQGDIAFAQPGRNLSGHYPNIFGAGFFSRCDRTVIGVFCGVVLSLWRRI